MTDDALNGPIGERLLSVVMVQSNRRKRLKSALRPQSKSLLGLRNAFL
jgi:hypothetical protein